MHVAAVLGACVIVATRCMTLKEALKAIDWNCLILVGALSVISTGGKEQWRWSGRSGSNHPYPWRQSQPFHDFYCYVLGCCWVDSDYVNIPTILVFMPIGISIAQQIESVLIRWP